ncbi:hypothetical protein [Novosphingopyxis sp.]|uniref:hypothetical protein n=1 Tax=Novosphingopyxis sp. TaxID=2709690 RepID=UPI003B5A83C1
MPEPQAETEDRANKWAWVAAIILGIVVIKSVIGSHGPSDLTTESELSGADELTVGEAVTDSEQSLQSPAQFSRAKNHAERSIGAMGPDGALFYSQRCYEALARDFQMETLDRCYTFDILASKLINNSGQSFFNPYFSQFSILSRWESANAPSVLTTEQQSFRREAIDDAAAKASVAVQLPPPTILAEPEPEQPLESDIVDPADVQSASDGEAASVFDSLPAATESDPFE